MNYQLPTIDYRRLTIDHRPSTFTGELSTIDHRPSTVNRGLTTLFQTASFRNSAPVLYIYRVFETQKTVFLAGIDFLLKKYSLLNGFEASKYPI